MHQFIQTARRYWRMTLFVLRWGMRLLSASTEIHFRRNFGRRYLPMLMGAFLLFTICSGVISPAAPLTTLFFLVTMVQVIRHCLFAFFRTRLSLPEPHTLWTGDSWDVWQRLGYGTSTVQCYIEPALSLILGLLVLNVDPLLGFWLAASGLALFVKEQLIRIESLRHILNAADGRIEAQRLNSGLNRYLNQSARGTQRPHRAQLAHPMRKTHP